MTVEKLVEVLMDRDPLGEVFLVSGYKDRGGYYTMPVERVYFARTQDDLDDRVFEPEDLVLRRALTEEEEKA